METKKCTFCGEEISSELRRCPFCGSLMGSQKQDSEQQETNHSSVPSDVSAAQMCVEQKEDGTIVIKECGLTEGENVSDSVQDNNKQSDKIHYMDSAKFANYNSENKGLGNGLKVFLTIISTVIPGLGQLIGIITSIIFINSEDRDKYTFGIALMVASIIFFLLSCAFAFIAIVAVAVR